MKLTKRTPDVLVYGAPPVADLLPPEVGLRVKARALRRTMVAFLVIVALGIVAGFVLASGAALGTHLALEAANARTTELLNEQNKYIEVRQVTGLIDAVEEGRRVGTSTEINWKSYMESIQTSLPAGTTITNFAVESATPTTNYSEATDPLQGKRMAQIVFTATSPSLPDVQAWLDALTGLPGFVDAVPNTVVLETANEYQVGITMHVNDAALSNRFAPVEPAADSETESEEG